MAKTKISRFCWIYTVSVPLNKKTQHMRENIVMVEKANLEILTNLHVFSIPEYGEKNGFWNSVCLYVNVSM
jgi:hypothetical protein